MGEEGEGELRRLRQEIDRIDDALHDLLMRRTEIAVRVGEVKAAARPVTGASPAEGAKFIRPAREAQIIRRLVARHRGRLPRQALVGMWREMIAALLQVEGPFAVAVFAPPAQPGYWDMARDHYGRRVAILPFAAREAALAAVREGRATVAILPYPAAEAEPWWPLLLRESAAMPHVIACLPFGDPGNQRDAGLRALVLGHAASEPSGRDRSLIARASDAPPDGLGGRRLHSHGGRDLIEVEGFVSPEAARRGGAHWLGAYAEPLTRSELDGMTGPGMEQG